MVRDFTMGDLAQVMRLWLETNISAHDFLPSSYWKENYSAVEKAIPQAQVFVFEEQGEIKGFLGLYGQEIQGIFVENNSQGGGIGKALLAFAKKSRSELRLQVYEKNCRAISFYQREGFRFVERQVDQDTGEAEWVMEWEK